MSRWKYRGPSKKVTSSEWHHVTAVFSNTKDLLFIDGQLASLKEGQFPDVGTRSRDYVFVLGHRFVTSQYRGNHFDGSLDDVRIYNRALSAAEVKALYEFEKAD